MAGPLLNSQSPVNLGTGSLGSSGSLPVNNPLALSNNGGTPAPTTSALQNLTSPRNTAFNNINLSSPPSTAGTTTPTDPNSGILAQLAQQSASTQALLKQIAALDAANAPGTASNLNVNALRSQANSQAASTVNPLYSQYLNQYLQGLAGQAGSSDVATLQNAANTGNYSGLNGAAEQQNTLNIGAEQTSLANTLASNQLQQNQAANTNALQQGNINVEQQNYQLQSGNAQNQKMQALQQQIGTGNLGGSGLGQQQIYQAENAKNLADAAQAGQYQYQRDTGNLSTQDTFAQLALSSQQATTGEGQAEKQTNFNLNNYLRQAAASDQATQESLSQYQQTATTAAQQNFLAQNLTNTIQGLGLSSKNLIATNQAYSPYLSTTAMPTYDIQGAINNIPQAGTNL